MLADKHIPTCLIDSSEHPEILLASPQEPVWWRPLVVILKLVGVIGKFFWLRWWGRASDFTEYGFQVKNSFEQLGPLWIKVGQIFSLRSDMLPPEVCDALAKIQESDVGMPFKWVRSILEEELARPLESIFDQFEETPFDATTLVQLHRAHLRREKIWVVVKIQKSHVQRIFSQDKVILEWMIRLLKCIAPAPQLRWNDLGKQVTELMKKELDFRYEATSLRRLKKKLGHHGIYVPTLFSNYSTSRVLTLEFVQGVFLSDLVTMQDSDPARLNTWLEENHIQLRKVARRLFFSVYRQIFEDGTFHCDLHPANIILLRDNRLAILDCRLSSFLESEQLQKYRQFLFALVTDQYDTAADLYLLLAGALPDVDLSRVKADVIRSWRLWITKVHVKGFPYPERSITTMFARVNEIVFRYHFPIQWPLVKLMYAWANLDIAMGYLRPAANYIKLLKLYLQRADHRTQSGRVVERAVRKRLSLSLGALQRLPEQYSEYALLQQSVLRLQARSFRNKTSKMGVLIGEIMGIGRWVLLFLEGFALGVWLQQSFHFPLHQLLGDQLAAIIHALPVLSTGVWLVILTLGACLLLIITNMKAVFDELESVTLDAQSPV